VKERRIARLKAQIQRRLANALLHEIGDPRLGLVTISKLEMDREMDTCKVYWSQFGDEKERKLSAGALEHANGFLRRQVAQVLKTRTVPKLVFIYDESVAGAQRMRELLLELRRERGETGPLDAPDPGTESEPDESADSD
jgi:ribosome-binding factor A